MADLPERDDTGKYPAFAWPGGYPLVYVDKDNESLCAEDAWLTSEGLGGCFVHYEGPPEICVICGEKIESAYGDPEEEAS